MLVATRDMGWRESETERVGGGVAEKYRDGYALTCGPHTTYKILEESFSHFAGVKKCTDPLKKLLELPNDLFWG